MRSPGILRRSSRILKWNHRGLNRILGLNGRRRLSGILRRSDVLLQRGNERRRSDILQQHESCGGDGAIGAGGTASRW